MQCYLYMRDPENPSEPDSCHYSFPLPISPVFDAATLELVRIDILPTGLDGAVKPVGPWQARKGNEYIPEARIAHDLQPLETWLQEIAKHCEPQACAGDRERTSRSSELTGSSRQAIVPASVSVAGWSVAEPS